MAADLLNDHPLSLKQEILLKTDGTVTDLIALFSGEAIHITKLAQETLKGRGPRELDLQDDARLLRRVILLSGAEGHYLYAESWFVVDRMQPEMQRALLETETPIGLLWKRARLEMYRELVDRRLEQRPELREHFVGADDNFLSRTYVVWHRQQPLGVITEKFPACYFAKD